jgi:SAM-dependent methyltransferase
MYQHQIRHQKLPRRDTESGVVPCGERSKFADEWPRFDRMLAGYDRHMLRSVEIEPGHIVLDIGCGAGATTLAAAARLEHGGRALGIDRSADAIDVARERLLEAGLDNAELIHGDAARYPFAPFLADSIVSRFGTMHFEDPVAAYTHLHAALKPGGRLAFVSWREARRNAWASIPYGAVSMVRDPSSSAGKGGPFAFARPERVRGVLAAAGFDDVTLTSIDDPVCVGSNVEAAIDFTDATELCKLGLTTLERRRVHGALRTALTPFANNSGVWLPASAWLVEARRPV